VASMSELPHFLMCTSSSNLLDLQLMQPVVYVAGPRQTHKQKSDNNVTDVLPLQGSASLPKGRLDKVHKQGVMFITYSLLIASLKKATLQTVDDQNVDTSNGVSSDLPDPRAQGVLPGTRLFHVVEWLAGKDRQGNCLIILDECHKAKNLIAKEGDHALAHMQYPSSSFLGCGGDRRVSSRHLHNCQQYPHSAEADAPPCLGASALGVTPLVTPCRTACLVTSLLLLTARHAPLHGICLLIRHHWNHLFKKEHETWALRSLYAGIHSHAQNFE